MPLTTKSKNKELDNQQNRSTEGESSTDWTSTEEQPTEPPMTVWKPENQHNRSVREKQESFAFYLYRMMNENADGENIVYSPLSIYSALSVIGRGIEFL